MSLMSNVVCCCCQDWKVSVRIASRFGFGQQRTLACCWCRAAGLWTCETTTCSWQLSAVKSRWDTTSASRTTRVRASSSRRHSSTTDSGTPLCSIGQQLITSTKARTKRQNWTEPNRSRLVGYTSRNKLKWTASSFALGTSRATAGPGENILAENSRLENFFLIFRFKMAHFGVGPTLYFWATACPPPNVAGPGENFPLSPLLDGPGSLWYIQFVQCNWTDISFSLVSSLCTRLNTYAITLCQ